MTVRVGVLGGGVMAGVHASALLGMGSVRLQALSSVEISPALGRLAADARIEVVEPEALFERSDIDAVVIATPTDTHAGIALRAIDAGWDVFCEKPLAREVADAERMVEAARAQGVRLAVGHVVRYMPAYARVRREMREGRIGNLGVARLRRLNSSPSGGRPWYGDPGRSGGVLLDMGIHDLDWALWALGPVERVSALRSKRDDREVAMMTLAHLSGALSSIELSWCHPGGFAWSIEVSGSTGLLRADSDAQRTLHVERDEKAHGHGQGAVPARPLKGGVDTGSGEAYRLQLEEVMAWFDGGEAPLAQGVDGLEALRVGVAALQSAETRSPVSLVRP